MPMIPSSANVGTISSTFTSPTATTSGIARNSNSPRSSTRSCQRSNAGGGSWSLVKATLSTSMMWPSVPDQLDRIEEDVLREVRARPDLELAGVFDVEHRVPEDDLERREREFRRL